MSLLRKRQSSYLRAGLLRISSAVTLAPWWRATLAKYSSLQYGVEISCPPDNWYPSRQTMRASAVAPQRIMLARNAGWPRIFGIGASKIRGISLPRHMGDADRVGKSPTSLGPLRVRNSRRRD